MDAGAEDQGVALGEGAGRADLAAAGRVVHQELGLVDLLLEAVVDAVEVPLLDEDLLVARGVACGGLDVRRLNLSGHRLPF